MKDFRLIPSFLFYVLLWLFKGKQPQLAMLMAYCYLHVNVEQTVLIAWSAPHPQTLTSLALQ